jgi:Spy/CpxP family protein refolding chaperone
MNKNRFAKLSIIAAGPIFLFAASGPAHADGAPHGAQAPIQASPGPIPKSGSVPADVFDGLNYTDEQKAEIAKIRQDIAMRRAAVAKDDKLNQDQKDAMLLGYEHMENSAIFKVLTPAQKRQVHQKLARRAADQAGEKNQAPRN